MSPDVAATIVARVACPKCEVDAGDRCQRRNGRSVQFPHQERVYADLFTPHPKSPRS